MNDLLKTRMLSLLSEASQVTNEGIQNAYGCFTEQLRTISQSERDYSEIFRELNTTRAELVFLKPLFRYEQGKKYPKVYLSPKGSILGFGL